MNGCAMPKTRRGILFRTAKALAILFAAITAALKTFVFPESVMQWLQILQTLAIIGVVLLTVLLAAMRVATLFVRNAQRGTHLTKN
jgi:hypothetical protein